ncbi:MAG TPA: DUF2235 domain-containing protein [Rhodopila sp.]|uniref:T6SS phospholipase effector Tle1-like catalytic domain-containing protein n=1 Tax=Rhodopila sp. TaxID=2480087 RepID=UPI002C1BD492|nr:DUF2235 domain-containing protein [Rhodopila sp.]HVY15498.1 DUF2235 domain-containing protein [Rhodopila sp.]
MGRVLTFIAWFVGLFVSLAAGAWWFNTVVIGLALRWAESRWPLHRGRLSACAIVLFGFWAAFALISAGVTLAAVRLLYDMLADSLSDMLPKSLSRDGYKVVYWGTVFVIVVGLSAGFCEVRDAWNAARRRRFLEDTQRPEQPVDLPRGNGEGRRIVVLCDGTSNRPDETEDGESSATNIWKLAQALVADETQIVFYQAGVGTDTSSTAKEARRTQRLLSATGGKTGSKIAAWWSMLIKLIETGTGAGISETIVNGYREIVRNYQPGDRIYLVGFSRGAFAARCIAGVIYRCGVLRAEYIRFCADMVQIYRARPSPRSSVAIRTDMAYPPARTLSGPGVTIEFVGVFDTVASLGFPLWGWWFRVLPIWKNLPFATDPVAVCRTVYHALSMDERRSQFIPTLFSVPEAAGGPAPSVHQVWFRGTHGDIGGGYARKDLSDVTLDWMVDAMRQQGLTFHPGKPDTAPHDLAPIHDELELEPTWRTFGTWPRWHPVPGGTDPVGYSSLHPSVLHRAQVVCDSLGRFDMRRLQAGESVEFVMDANRDWYRTGIVIETGAHYRMTYIGGLIRDGECPLAEPDGQRARGLDVRHLLGFGRRLPRDRWMLLAATIAHPRAWPPMEKPFSAALRYLFTSAPAELQHQIARIGRHLGTPGASICLTSAAPSGLLHLFANDWWQTASNNSGGPRLRITRIDGAEPDAPLWSLSESGEQWTVANDSGHHGAS